MKKILHFHLSLAFFFCLTTATAQTLTLAWQTDTLLRVPESVLFDANNKVLYVSNIDGAPDGKDGKGFISKVSPAGKIIKLEWVSGLDAPKGMGLFKNNLYVADLARVVVIDITTGKITSTIEIEGAQFLNDVTVDAKGNVYVSDSNTAKIHKVSNNKAELYFESKELVGPNGLLALKEGLYVANFGNGTFYKLSWDKKITKISDVAPNGSDGIVITGKDEFIISCWGGEIYVVNAAGKSTKLLDTQEQKINAADVDFDPKTNTLYVPTFFANSVMAYTLNR